MSAGSQKKKKLIKIQVMGNWNVSLKNPRRKKNNPPIKHKIGKIFINPSKKKKQKKSVSP